MTGSSTSRWTPEDTIRAQVTVEELSRREMAAKAHMRTARDAQALKPELAGMRAELAALNAKADARERGPE